MSYRVAVSPDGKRVAYCGEDQQTVIADAATGRTLRILPVKTRGLGVAFSPDGGLLALIGRDGYLRLWLIDGAAVLCELTIAAMAVFVSLDALLRWLINWSFLVVDELHTFDGAQGTDLACLLRRLKDRLKVRPGQLCCVAEVPTAAAARSWR